MVDLSLIKPENLWYVVGLITTDGNLSKDRRHISITSKDISQIHTFKKCLGIKNKIGIKSSGFAKNKKYYNLQFGSVNFYNFLLKIGLTPAKSRTLSSLKIPPEYFSDFLRGIIDGDGSINKWTHNDNKNTQWALRVTSAAPIFIQWLKYQTENTFGVKGKLHITKKVDRKPIYNIKFGKFAAQVILTKCYYKNCVALERKNKLAKLCIETKNLLKKYSNTISPGGGIGYTQRT
ncbi:MAG: LAGLIDADG family homing endonuclease [Parcubacteria group bacterium]|nr:LAGLIDADG family homing endonuclease [Parcubacteria group bacterium]